jgi:hypothetical protein
MNMKDFSKYRQVDVTSNCILYVPDTDPDILMVVPREGTLDTGEDARQNVEHFHAYARSLGRSCGAVVIMANMLAQDAEARAAYQGIDIQLFYAGALVVEDALSRALGSFFLGLSRPNAPTRLFDTVDKAVEWLKTMRPKPNEGDVHV